MVRSLLTQDVACTRITRRMSLALVYAVARAKWCSPAVRRANVPARHEKAMAFRESFFRPLKAAYERPWTISPSRKLDFGKSRAAISRSWRNAVIGERTFVESQHVRKHLIGVTHRVMPQRCEPDRHRSAADKSEVELNVPERVRIGVARDAASGRNNTARGVHT